MVALLVAAVGAVVVVAAPAGAASPPGQLSVGDELHRNQALLSPNGEFALVVDDRGDVTVEGPVGTVWAAPRSGGATLVMQGDGNLVDYNDWDGRPTWASGTGVPGSVAVMQDDGNLVIYAPGGRAVWASKSERQVLGWSDDRLMTGQRLNPGESLTSPSGSWQALLQNDGNLVVYGPSGASWASGTAGQPGNLTMQGDGNVVLYEWNQQALWHTHTADRSGALLVLGDDGNLVLYRPDGTALWSSRTSPGVKVVRNLLPAGSRLANGMILISPNYGFRGVMQRDGNFVVYGPGGPNWASRTGEPWSASLLVTTDGDALVAGSPTSRAGWHSGTAGNPGAVLVLQDDGNLVVYRANGTAAWASLSPWTWTSVPAPYAPMARWW
jgi:hypothetical protein